MTSGNLSLEERNGNLYLRVPYELKDAFRALFKTATWDGTDKAFVAKSTTANKNKWEAFVTQAQSLKSTLAARENAAVTERELRNLVEKVESTRINLVQAIAIAEERIAAHERSIPEMLRVVAALGHLKSSAEAREVEVRAAATNAKAEAEPAVAPALAVASRHELSELLRRMAMAARKGWPGKQDLGESQAALCRFRNDLAKVGYRHATLDELCDMSLNRPDKFTDTVPRLEMNFILKLEAIDDQALR